MTQTALFVSFLVVFWLLLSGHYDPLLLCLGALSCALVWYISHRMDIVDHEDHPLHLHPVKLVTYFGWLCVEVAKSNLDVSLRIIKPSMPIQPKLLRIRTSQRTELGQVIFANSITLTPGTVSIDLDGHEIQVHALAAEPASGLLGGDMDRRVSAVERPHPDDPRAGSR